VDVWQKLKNQKKPKKGFLLPYMGQLYLALLKKDKKDRKIDRNLESRK
jgi:hypothetical protein